MSRYCTHYVEIGEEAHYVGNKLRNNSSSHIGNVPMECGQEVDMGEPYCAEHTAMYTKEELEDG